MKVININEEFKDEKSRDEHYKKHVGKNGTTPDDNRAFYTKEFKTPEEYEAAADELAAATPNPKLPNSVNRQAGLREQDKKGVIGYEREDGVFVKIDYRPEGHKGAAVVYAHNSPRAPKTKNEIITYYKPNDVSISKAIIHFSPNPERNAKGVLPEDFNPDKALKEHKQKQYEIIQSSNPKDEKINKYACWIDSPEDVLTYEEALREDGGYDDGVTPDFTAEDIQKALRSGFVVVYSTYPIKNGTFVTPSKMEAESYGIRDRLYSKLVALTDVAWIDGSQGQYAKVEY